MPPSKLVKKNVYMLLKMLQWSVDLGALRYVKFFAALFASSASDR